MSERELQRVEVLSQVAEGTMSVTMAAAVLGVSARQVQRLLRRFRAEGADAMLRDPALVSPDGHRAPRGLGALHRHEAHRRPWHASRRSTARHHPRA